MSLFSHAKFSIAICTYNPDMRSFSRLLDAVAVLCQNRTDVEVVLVDNNSSPSLNVLPRVQKFLLQALGRCVVEPKQGLIFARCRAIRETNAPIVVFFDDDNEPAPDYLHVLERYFCIYSNVGAWGPGLIKVEYVGPVDQWFHQHPEKFQSRKKEFAYGCIQGIWADYMPNGTGLAVRREILQRYVSEVERGTLKASGRTEQCLSSAEDVQIVWEGIKMGYAAGMIPELFCRHLIAASKANMNYLEKLVFGTASSYMPALLESFPEKAMQKLSVNFLIVRRVLEMMFILSKLVLVPYRRREIQLEIAAGLGGLYGIARALKSDFSGSILSAAKRFNLA